MTLCRTLACIVALATTWPAAQRASDPFAALAPAITFSDADRRQLETGRPVVRTLDVNDDTVAMVAAVRTTITADRLREWTRAVEQLKKSPLVQQIHKLSADPTRSEFDAIHLSNDEANDMRGCRVGDCDIKLTAAEITRARPTLARAGAGWRATADQLFQDFAFERVRDYRVNGPSDVVSADGRDDASIRTSMQALVDASSFLSAHAPDLAAYLLSRPRQAPPGESFIYWSTELVSGKPVTSATEVVIPAPGAPWASSGAEFLAATSQVFAAHYSSASLGLTVLLPSSSPDYRYLVVTNRTTLDMLGGFFGGFARRAIQSRIRKDSASLIADMRTKMEAGPPWRQ